MELEWTAPSLEDMAARDRGVARRIQRALERFARTGSGDVKRLQGIDTPEFRLRAGD